MIPRRLIRSVPAETTAEVERFWQTAAGIHPGWQMVTHRDPIDPAGFPLTSPWWPRCQNGAQLAGLVRLEELWNGGGIWLDSDIELFRPLDPLLGCAAFACWEDANVVPDAVLGAEPNHPAIKACLDLALRRIQTNSGDWRTGNGAWATGPGATTTVLPGRDDVLLLPPAAFFSVHYTAKETIPDHVHDPWEFGIHWWHGSWL